MADNVTVDNGALTDYSVSSDEAASGQVQRMKLAYSADGVDTHVGADADGLLVNLGANNDISGTVTAVEESSSTGTVTSVAASASNVTLLASNAARMNATIWNDSTAICYVKCAATASTTSFTYRLDPQGVCELPVAYTGIIDAIWASATGSARITEFS